MCPTSLRKWSIDTIVQPFKLGVSNLRAAADFGPSSFSNRFAKSAYVLTTNRKKTRVHFPTSKKLRLENDEKHPTDFFVGVFTYLKEQLWTRFRDFEIAEDRTRVFENPTEIW